MCTGRATRMQEKVTLLCPQHDVMCVMSSRGTQNLPPPLTDGEAEVRGVNCCIYIASSSGMDSKAHALSTHLTGLSTVQG